jgi:hypothetical protein
MPNPAQLSIPDTKMKAHMCGICETDLALGPVDIHFNQIMVATRNSTDANDKRVFS